MEATSCEVAGRRSLQLSSRYVCPKCLADQRASGPQADARAEALEAEIESRDAELAVAAGKLAQMAGLMQQVDALNKQARKGWAAGLWVAAVLWTCPAESAVLGKLS